MGKMAKHLVVLLILLLQNTVEVFKFYEKPIYGSTLLTQIKAYKLSRFQATAPSIDTSSGSEAPISRKGHKNKYENFSKKKSDPLMKLMELQRKKAEVEITKVKAPIRGTTVPTQPKSISKPVSTTKSLSPKSKATVGQENSISNTSHTSKSSTIEQDVSAKDNAEAPRRTLFTPAKVNRIQPSDPYTFGYIEIGRVLKSHGVRGEMKFYATADTIDDLRLGSHSVVYVKKPSRRTPRPIQLLALRKQVGSQYLISFEGVGTRDLAEGFRDYTVYIKLENRPQLVDDEYMIRDLIGLSCYKLKTASIGVNTVNATSDELINSADYVHELSVGVVEGVVPPDELCSPEMAKLMHSMLEIKFHHNEELCLVPLVPAIVRHVDIANRVLVMDPPDGLLELTYSEVKKYVLRGYLPARCESLTDEMRRQLASATVFVSALPPLIPA